MVFLRSCDGRILTPTKSLIHKGHYKTWLESKADGELGKPLPKLAEEFHLWWLPLQSNCATEDANGCSTLHTNQSATICLST